MYLQPMRTLESVDPTKKKYPELKTERRSRPTPGMIGWGVDRQELLSPQRIHTNQLRDHINNFDEYNSSKFTLLPAKRTE